MSLTTFSGPLKVGTNKDTQNFNQGSVELAQTGLIAQTAAGTTNLTFMLPVNCQITNTFVDVITAWDSITSAGLTIGTVSAGTQYRASVDVKLQTARATWAPTNAQGLAAANTTTNTSVVVTVVSVGTTTVGTARVTLQYIQL